jgi:hypothetical protein
LTNFVCSCGVGATAVACTPCDLAAGTGGGFEVRRCPTSIAGLASRENINKTNRRLRFTEDSIPGSFPDLIGIAAGFGGAHSMSDFDNEMSAARISFCQP